MTDSELLDRCIDGDRKAWVVLVEKCSRPLYNAVKRTLLKYRHGDWRENLEDLHNQTFLALLEQNARKLRQFQRRCSIETWVATIGVNLTLNFLKKEGRLEPLPKEELLSGNPLPHEVIIESERNRVLEQLLSELNPGDSLLLKYLFVDGLRPEKVAQIMGIEVNALYTRKHRIIQRLKARVLGNGLL